MNLGCFPSGRISTTEVVFFFFFFSYRLSLFPELFNLFRVIADILDLLDTIHSGDIGATHSAEAIPDEGPRWV